LPENIETPSADRAFDIDAVTTLPQSPALHGLRDLQRVGLVGLPSRRLTTG
jgi:hypothetical protein